MNICETITKNSLIGIGWFLIPDMMIALHLNKNNHAAAKVLAIAGVVGRVVICVLALAIVLAGGAMLLATGAATLMALAATPLGIAAVSLVILGLIGFFWMTLQFFPVRGAFLAVELEIF